MAGGEEPGRWPKPPLFSGILFGLAPSPDLLGYDMTVPAGGFGPGIIVASVAELFLVAVTFQTGPRKADLKDPSVRRGVGPDPLPDGAFPPGAEEFHMVRPHERGRLHAEFFLQPLDGGRIQLQVGRGNRLSPAIPEREGGHDQKDHDPGDDFPPVIELHRLPFLPAVRRAGPSSFPFPPS